MASELFVLTLLRAQAAASLAVLLVLVLRAPARRRIGVGLSYRLWLLVATAAFISPFPTLSEFLHRAPPVAGASLGAAGSPSAIVLRALTTDAFWFRTAPWLTWTWAAGALALATLFFAAELRFRRLARLGLAGPAMVGVAAPRFVTPHDYHQRFSERERDLILRHERAHLAQGDPIANLLIAGFQVLFWFNPLIHIAAAQIKLDQELACDALVIEGRPKARRAYANALIKAHLTGPQSALVCAWAPMRNRIGLSCFARTSPLEHRLRALTWGDVSLTRYLAGLVLVGGLAVSMAVGVWIAAPGQRYDSPAGNVRPGETAWALILQLSPALGR
jgi:beta-lactamase regulating signal transducer with metallopeptidase domain